MSEILVNSLTDIELRYRLIELAMKDLLGPAGGDREEICERNVRDRYLVGVLAPARWSQAELVMAAGVKESSPLYGDEEEDDEDTPAIPDELAAGGQDSLDDGTTDQDVPVGRAHFPSSIGFTFSVREDTSVIDVEARWGQYLRAVKEEQINERTGKPIRVWRRFPRGGTLTILLKVGDITPQSVDPECPGVVVKGRVRKREHGTVVTLFLLNGQELASPRDTSFVFQPFVRVTAPEGAAAFERKAPLRSTHAIDQAIRLEEDRLELLYRRHIEFAVGHGVGVHAETSAEASDRAIAIETRIIPHYEVPRSTPPTAADISINSSFARLDGLVLDMKELAATPGAEIRDRLASLTAAYSAWIDAEEKLAKDAVLGPLAEAGRTAVEAARKNLQRIEEGLDLLVSDPKAAQAFAFMNEAMWLQRTHSIYSEKVRRGESPVFETEIDIPVNRTWYPFQIAFILLNLPALTLLDHADRAPGQLATADLLFFPTGGGKTEAYLGLSAYTMAIRRLQGPVAGRSSEHGLAVLMRYTLRLLTIQQFQRAAALLCSCEVIRRRETDKGQTLWGAEPFRIGLWVGQRTTPNWTEDSAEAIQQHRGNQAGFSGGAGTPYQLTACPWCGKEIKAGRDLHATFGPSQIGRTFTYCGDPEGACPFSRRQAPDEGLPVVVVDEEIYRRLPSMLIATVDKFAQMPWRGEVGMLFGQVDGRCERHGFRSPEIEDTSTHPRAGALLPAKTVPFGRLRPPDLIIQDELHLISGPLGSLVGLYETAVDRLCSWEVDGKVVRPKVVASTATIRNAAAQVHGLFLRRVNVFPPQGIDVRDSFFSVQREPGTDYPGRYYLGICAPGRRLKAALIRVYVAFLCSAQTLYETYGQQVDPWMTLVGYFNSIRELGGMRRLVDDDVASRAKKMDARGLAKRFLTPNRDVEELTSRIRSEDIPFILDRLEAVFDPATEWKTGKLEEKGKDRARTRRRLDVLLATNMISVGIDVKRLGLMVVGGQPKSTAEYIQATSRVGRSRPGIVCTVFNWARPRDLSHYERFEHYHGTFYKHVEALSVTPFSTGAIKRGLAGLLVGMLRQHGTEMNRNDAAGRIQKTDPAVDEIIECIAKRASLVGTSAAGDECRAQLRHKVDLWSAEAQNKAGGRTLTFGAARGKERGTSVPLLQRPGLERWDEFTCLNSLREVEPTVKLIALDAGGLDEDKAPAVPAGPASHAGTMEQP
jgi:hypothetical protein